MGVSGGTLSRCCRRSQSGWPAMNRSRIKRVLAFGPISPKALTAIVSQVLQQSLTDPRHPAWQSSQTDVGSPLGGRANHNVQWALRPSRPVWLVSLPAPREPHSACLLQGGTGAAGRPPIRLDYSIKDRPVLVPTGRYTELRGSVRDEINVPQLWH